MKFKVEIQVEVLDEELLMYINNACENEERNLYNSIDEVPESEIMEWCEHEEGYFRDDITDYGFDINKITIIKE